MTTLQGKRIFISGAAAGMGYSVARLAVEAGAQVHATDLSLDGLKNLAQDGVNTALLGRYKPGGCRGLLCRSA